MRLLVLTSAFLLFFASTASAYSFGIQPPSTLTLDGQSISEGTFTVQGVTAYSDPGAVITPTIVLDFGNAGDDILIAATIGSSTVHSLFSVADATEVVRIQGFFDATTPNLPNANFDIWVGTFSPTGITAFTDFLPSSTSDFSYQITDVAGAGLGDNTDVFSSILPVLSLTNPGGTFIELDNGETNSWFVSYTPSAVQMVPHGTSVPEPSTGLLVGMGLSLWLMVDGRRNRSRP